MKIRADEHISPEIVRIVCELALSPGWELTQVITQGDGGMKDVPWITKFAGEGGKVILSGDTDFINRPHQVMAVLDTGLIVVHMHNKYCNARGRLQAAHMLWWWDKIEATLQAAQPRQCWRVPWGFPESGGELSRLSVDYEKARKKIEREEQRAIKAVQAGRDGT